MNVTVVEELGADSFVYGTCDVEGVPSNVIVRMTGRHHPQKGERLYVTTDPQPRARVRHRHRGAALRLSSRSSSTTIAAEVVTR